MDKKDFFLYPVTTDVAPDYFNIIDKPMAFSDIIDKFHAHEYSTLDDVEADLSLIWKNCKTYNRSDTSYYRLAQRMEEQAKEWMTQARQDYNMLEISLQAGTLAVGIDPDIFSYDLIQPSPEPSHDSYDNQQKELEISKQEPQQELDQQMHQETGKKKNEKELSLPSTRSDRKKQLPSSTSSRRTTRSSSTGLIELSLDKYLSEKSRKSKRARKAATASTDVSDKSNSISSTSFTSALSSNTSSDRSPEIMVTPSSSLPTSPSPQPQLSQETEKNTRKIKKKDKAISTVTRRMTRSAGSEGLTVPTKSAMKNSKMNSETRKLLWSDSVTKPIAYVEGSYKESKTKRAPRGYVYISSSDEDGSNDEEQGDNSMIKTTNATSIISPSSKRNKKSNKLSHGKQPLEVEPLSTFAHLQTTTIEKVVWARVSGFPFHPAKIVDPNKEDVPKNVRTGKPKAQSSLVKFFMVPENHQW
ncbi:uncharacterized protein BX664DRAFT_63515 [Halteromyces radiatus]|uniref:uncharacterized protein n=1 Tax=Halteromyces radiatus TaxID=101107 RepID=UPI00221FC9A6|nr:uncharacterized protein BX664DRAFT_63515 [Halteromyces radiatus]KAI8096645.1 hypothetical protein BX664DRAFT_63515 [Halteromyces radiatus]